MNSKLLNLNWGDAGKALVMSVLGGFALPLLAAVQTPGFNFQTADWNGILVLAINGAIAAAAAYLMKNLFSDEQGRFMGKVG